MCSAWKGRINNPILGVKRLNPKSNQHLISPCSIATESFFGIMRGKEIIANLRSFDC